MRSKNIGTSTHPRCPNAAAGTLAAAILLSIIVIPLGASAQTGPAQVTLAFERQGLDLETGTIHPQDAEESASFVLDSHPEADFVVAFDGNQAIKAVLLQNDFTATRIAHLAGNPFASVGAGVIPGLEFTENSVDTPVSPEDTVVLLTSNGAYYKIGNIVVASGGVTFDYEQLQ